MKKWQENQLTELMSIQNEGKLFEKITLLCKDLGFDYCAYGLRTPYPITKPKVFMVNNYSEEWQLKYQARNYLAVDPTVQHGMRSILPLIWNDKIYRLSPELWEEARSFGLRIGWAQSIHDHNGIKGLLTFCRSNEPLIETELEAKSFKMNWLAQMAHICLSRCLTPKLMPETNVKLSNREITVLRWTAEGKTTSDISHILNIADCTVNFHINNALVKLNATNKTSATVKAALLGIL